MSTKLEALVGRPCGLGFVLCVACSGTDVSTSRADVAYPYRGLRYESAGHTLGYVANRFEDTVSVVDLDSMQVVGVAPVGRDPVEIDGPRHLVWHPGAAAFYTVLGYPFDVASPHVEHFGGSVRVGYVQMLGLPDLRPVGEFRVRQRADDIGLSQDGTQLAITHFDTLRSLTGETLDERRSSLVVVDDPENLEASTTSARSFSACVAPSAVTYGKDPGRVFVVCTGEDSLGVFDTLTGSLVSMVPAGPNSPNKPLTIAVDPSGTRIAVANQLSESVAIFSAEDQPRLLASIGLSATPMHIAWVSDADFVVALQQPNGAARVSVESGRADVSATYSTDECETPSEPRFLPGGRLLLVCEGDHYAPGALVELEPDTLAVRARVKLGLYPERMVVVRP